MIKQGDNLTIMKSMESETIDLVYLDPPFFSGRDYVAIPGSKADGAFFNDKHTSFSGQLPDRLQWLSHCNDGIIPYIGFMYERLTEMKRLMKSDASIYLHCDSNASHYLKIVMDFIFGPSKFRNHITWQRSKSKNQSGLTKFGNSSDHILFYSGRGINFSNIQLPLDKDYIDSFYTKSDSRGRYASQTLSANGISKGESGQPWKGRDVTAIGHHWKCPLTGDYAKFIEKCIPGYLNTKSVIARLELLEQNDFIVWSNNGVPRVKWYLEGAGGNSPHCTWTDIHHLQNKSPEYTGYPTQKPLKLLERIVLASSNIGDTVFDPFCGSGTSLVVAKMHKRRYIGIDLSADAVKVCQERLDAIAIDAPVKRKIRNAFIG